jgi:hypothetical protein
MTDQRQRPHGSIPVLVLIATASIAVQSLATGAETCSSGTCVHFAQWKTSASATTCNEALGADLWAFKAACCHPEVDPEWCTGAVDTIDVGSSTLRKMTSCTGECTQDSCSDSKPRVATSNMSIEFVSAARNVCNLEEPGE